uniref:pyridoxal 5'-phosphate synthase (glutamine hydrolyzing) n=1 Tax=Oryza meridionalis TaxID=40149 RepID=A0A0E0DP46_9ORYZ
MGEIRALRNMDDDKVFAYAKRIAAPYNLVMHTKQLGCLPVVQFAAGGVATPANAALMMQLGCDDVFVGSGIFKSGDPARRAPRPHHCAVRHPLQVVTSKHTAASSSSLAHLRLVNPKPTPACSEPWSMPWFISRIGTW